MAHGIGARKGKGEGMNKQPLQQRPELALQVSIVRDLANQAAGELRRYKMYKASNHMAAAVTRQAAARAYQFAAFMVFHKHIKYAHLLECTYS